jgi:hypothetical protein
MVERKEREGGKSFHPSTSAQGLLNELPYAGWWRVRERKRKGGKLLLGERNENFQDPQSIPLLS